MKTILFLCTGNICRSPMAEVLMDRLIKGRTDLRCLSAGISAFDGQPASDLAVEVMGEIGVSLRHHQSLSLRAGLVDQADYLFTMTSQQTELVTALYPGAAGKTCCLRQFEDLAPGDSRDIPDPIGLPREVYRQTRDTIRRALPGVLEFIDRQAAAAPPAPRSGSADAAVDAGSPPPVPPRIVLAADHGGVEIKAELGAWLKERGYAVADLGTDSTAAVDYPDYAYSVAAEILAGRAERGVLICKSGIGMGIAANRFAGVRAAAVGDVDAARLSRQHNDANVLVLSGLETTPAAAQRLLEVWLATPFAGGRHQPRVWKMDHPPRFGESGASPLAVQDPQIYDVVQQEKCRQQENIELIASENFVSPAVLEAVGSILTNKYAEGYPGRRYYGGCAHVDVIEQLAIDRAQQLFGAEHVNVQPHSGSQANMAVYFATVKHGDTILTMELSHGGHLTHGSPRNFSGKFYRVVHYGVQRDTETIDYDRLAALAAECRPKLITAGASAYPRTIDFPRLRQIADQVGALLFVDMAHIAGLVAAGLHPSPVPYADFVTTTTHKTLRGPRAGLILCRAKHARTVDSWVLPGIQGGPLMHIIAAKAVCFREALRPEFREYQRQIVSNAQALAAELQQRGLRIVSGGTDNHLMLVDLRPKQLTGAVAQEALDRAGITVNKNLIPYDPEKPLVASGIRLGTPAVTTRGMKEPEMGQIASYIGEVLERPDDRVGSAGVRDKVRALTARFPLPY